MSESDTRRDDEPDEFIEAQDGDYEPAPRVYDEDDLPVADEDEDDEIVPDDERPVPLDPDDAEIG